MRMNEVLKSIQERRSIRKFDYRPVPVEMLEKILNAARWAPSGGNQQPYRFIIVEDYVELVKAVSPNVYGDPPVIIAACLEYPKNASKDTECLSLMGLGSAIQNMLLAAHSLGLGSLWCGCVQMRREVEKILGIEEDRDVHVYSLIGIGYTAEKPEPPPRKALSEITFIEEIDKPWRNN